MILAELIEAQKARTARRARQKLIYSHKSIPVSKSLTPPGRKIIFFDKDENCHEIQVQSTEPHFVKCCQKKKCPALNIAYKDVRLVLENPIDYHLLSSELEWVSTGFEKEEDERINEEKTRATS